MADTSKKYCVHVFTGTGNSLHAARALKAALEDKGACAAISLIEKPQGCAMPAAAHVFMFPVYAACVPEIMLRHIGALTDATAISPRDLNPDCAIE